MTRSRLRVFVSSPGDVRVAREVAAQVTEKVAHEFARFFSIEPFLWEYEPMLASGHFQDSIDPPRRFDIVALILGSRLGTPLPERTAMREYRGIDGRTPVTGTEWEFEDALAGAREHGVPDILVYRSRRNAEVSTWDSESRETALRQISALDVFWRRHFADDGRFIGAYAKFDGLEDLAAKLEQDLRSCILRRLEKLGPEARDQRIRLWPKPPFRGLEAYGFEHAPIFFGREEAIGAGLLRCISSAEKGRPFLLVVGASGSGKSSLVTAGLVPRLLVPQRVSGTAFQRRTVFRPSDAQPDEDLFDALARRLTDRPTEGTGLPELLSPSMTVAEFARHLRETPSHPGSLFGLVLDRLADTARAAGRMLQFERAKLILVVDQLEEIFTSERVQPEERKRFIHLLRGLVHSGHVWVIATMRADFWHRAADTPELVELADRDGRLDLLPPTPAELSQMIRRPAEAAALAFEVHPASGIPLNDLIAEQAAHEPGALPLLSYLLDQLYIKDVHEAAASTLTYATYNALGGLKGAIATRADAVIAAQPLEGQQALRQVLFALVQMSEGEGSVERAVARRAPLSDFAEGTAKRRLVEALLDPSTRLLVAEASANGATVRLAHEALVSEWQTAQDYVAANAEALKTRRNVEARYARWQALRSEGSAHARGIFSSRIAAMRASFARETGLLADVDLADAERLLRDYRNELAPQLVGYVERSLVYDQRRRRRTVRVAATVAVITTMLAVGAGYEARVASRQRDAALQAQQHAALEARTAQTTTDFLVSIFKFADPAAARGNTISAREVLDTGAERARTQLATDPRVESRLLRSIGEVYTSLGLYPKAQGELEESLRIESSLNDDAGETALTKAALAAVLADRNEYGKAEQLYKDALGTLDTRKDLSREAARTRGMLGYLYFAMGNFRAARPVLEDALQRARSVFGPESDDVADILSTLGVTIRDTGDPRGALAILQQSNEMRRRLFGENYYWYCVGLANVGFTQANLLQYEDARNALQSALTCSERVLGPNHPFLSWQLSSLGRTEIELGHYDDGIRYLNRGLAIEEAGVDARSVDAGRILYYLAKAYAGKGDYERAFALYQRSAEIAKLRFGSESHEYMVVIHSFAMDQRRAGRLTDSIGNLRLELAISEKPNVQVYPQESMAILAALADSLCYRRVSAEGYGLAEKGLGMKANVTAPLLISIVESIAAYCDPDRSHVSGNAAVLRRAVAVVGKERGKDSPQAKDTVRRLARFEDFWRSAQ